MTKKIVIFLVLISSSLFAAGGSLYSRIGIGEISNTFSARRFALGGYGYALADRDNLNSINPAGWYKLGLTRIELGLNYSGMNIEDGVNSSFYSEMQFSGFALGFPVEKDLGIAAVVGIVPYSRVSYDVSQIKTLPEFGDYELKYSGIGGLSKIFIGSSFLLPLDFVMGIQYDYYFGEINYSSKLDFLSSSLTQDALFERKFSNSGSGLTLGVLSPNLMDLFENKIFNEIRLGIIYNYLGNIKSDSTLISRSYIGNADLSKGIVDVNLPHKFGAGISIMPNDNVKLVFDFTSQPWSLYKFNNKADERLKDYLSLSLGTEYKLSGVKSGTFFEQLSYRASLIYEELPYKIQGEAITKYAIRFGFSYPISSSNSLDFGFEYGKRGSNKTGQLNENIFGAVISLSLGELWFNRIER